jgi:hypothetical protein
MTVAATMRWVMPLKGVVDAGAELKRHYGGIADRVTVPTAGGLPPGQARGLLAARRRGSRRRDHGGAPGCMLCSG